MIYFNFGNISNLNSENFTISMWLKPDGVLSTSQSALSTQNIHSGYWDNGLQFSIDDPGGNNYIRWDNAPATNRIVHQAWITDSSVITD